MASKIEGEVISTTGPSSPSNNNGDSNTKATDSTNGDKVFKPPNPARKTVGGVGRGTPLVPAPSGGVKKSFLGSSSTPSSAVCTHLPHHHRTTPLCIYI